MQRFLLKTEPSVYSFDDLIREKTTVWDGVTNFAALKHMRSMHKGDSAFIYHSGEEKQIVGLAKIVSEPQRDLKAKNDKVVVVEVQAVQKLKNPVTLAVIKSKREFKNFPLVRIPRLSVMPVPEQLWNAILSLST
jgi:predicted RNA-binding protein with PUA-like domain